MNSSDERPELPSADAGPNSPRSPAAPLSGGVKRLPVKELAARINAHLKRFAATPEIARRKWTDGRGVERENSLYWNPGAWPAGAYVRLCYVSYQGSAAILRSAAEDYLAWLDGGHVGTHWAQRDEAARATGPASPQGNSGRPPEPLSQPEEGR